MLTRMKMYFITKRLERQMKYELLSHLYLFVSEKEKYLNIIHELANIPPEEMQQQLLAILANIGKTEEKAQD